jgi:hypothetical protein
VAAAVAGFALALCPGEPKKPAGKTKPTKIKPVRPSVVRRHTPDSRLTGRRPCGPSFCFNAEGDFVKPPERKLASEHCFLLARAPTEGRLWYVVLSHKITLKEKGEKQAKVIFTLDKKAFRILPKAAAMFGLRSGAVKPGRARALVGKRLFFMRRTRHGFAPAGRPRLESPVGAMMLAWAAGAAALCPFPPSASSSKWVDRRDLPPLLPSRILKVYRKWEPVKGPEQTRRRWKITPHLDKEPSAELKKVRLNGEASTLADGTWVERSRIRVERLDAVLKHLSAVRLELTHKGRRCVSP